MKIEAIVNITLLTRKHAFSNLNHSVGTIKFAINTYRGFYRNTSSASIPSAADVRYVSEVNSGGVATPVGIAPHRRSPVRSTEYASTPSTADVRYVSEAN